MKKSIFLILNLILLINCQRANRCPNDDLLIDTTSGKLQGSCSYAHYKKFNSQISRRVYTWLGVPYAEAPIGENRFKSPVPVVTKSEILNATKWPNSCMQLIDKSDYVPPENPTNFEPFPGFSMWRIDNKFSNMSEDCLYLNIFTPEKRNESYEIMVFFHGGSTVFGSSAMDVYNPSTLVAETNTIVITINYRLGVFGFLYLDNEFPGNQALQDQSEALKWISTNAEKFGGNPNKITIFGQSAGAMLGGYHLFYKKSWPYFTNIILQSGSPLFEPLFPVSKQEANRRGLEFLESIGCKNDTSSDLLECIKNSTSNSIAYESIKYTDKMAGNYHTSMFLMTAFVPVLDGEVISEHPVDSLKKGNFKKCPTIIGFNQNEGTLFSAVTGFAGLKSYNKIDYSTFNYFIDKYFHFYPKYGDVSKNLVKESIKFEYLNFINETNRDELIFKGDKNDYFKEMSDIFTHQMFVCPAYRLADLISVHNDNVFVYLFNHYLTSSPWPEFYGMTHSDELAFVFAHTISLRDYRKIISVNPWANSKNNNAERYLTLKTLNFWSNFVKYDNPNKSGFKLWPKYKSKMTNDTTMPMYGNVFRLNTGILKARKEENLRQCQFWNYLLPKIASEN
ncbi:unnamed protein product [Brachionus calyciflorus]|uniref:Carboxylic ester hydrolase n=1 Tax=Brachionus calyciflorus TaxID=104777 RepID=A0A814N3Q4_9BILA|nr:unnamed protein product [Brachionus calyciflorus]